MAAGRPSQFLDPLAAGGTLDDPAFKQKNAVIRAAQAQAEAIHEKLRRIGHDIPKYIFLELIGKGAYGRVFKWLVDPICLDCFRINAPFVL